MNFRGVYDKGMASCFNFVPNFGIWNILENVMVRTCCSIGRSKGKIRRNNWLESYYSSQRDSAQMWDR